MDKQDKILVQSYLHSIMLKTLLVDAAQNMTMPDKYFAGYADGIRKNALESIEPELRDEVRERAASFFDRLGETSKKGFLGDAVDILNELRGK